MSLSEPSAAADLSSASRNRLVLIVYTAAIFVSALLLFSVQPLFTKMVLPRLGGSPHPPAIDSGSVNSATASSSRCITTGTIRLRIRIR